ncbi:hypothetical protein [Loktanella sp. S4079]|uniref:hypothetical protein n=1 Tax=Loktanella sp. S4079 TaxID=579483 RepID=UPI0005F9FF04|nr:hypothetical protein [Loktanella sp. S4079]KJZ20835.1 hypothetical protein TW80_08830 [Loktanella sp. S4079]
MRALALLGVVGMALAGCMQDIGAQGDVLARTAAKGVVNNVVAAKLPGVDATPVTDCIIDNASGAEILTIAEAAVVGVDDATSELIVDILARPETARCAASGMLGVSL